MSAIVKSDGEWTRDRVELIKNQICHGVPDGEFSLFLEQCKRSGLDPLLKQSFCVKRRFNAGSKERPQWVDKYEFQPAEAGMLARAERFPDFEGCQAGATYSEDEILIDQGAGAVQHRFNPAKRKGSLIGAWSRVQRRGRLPIVVWVDFAAYVQQSPLWSKMPVTMIEKVARVGALRKAYPEAFGGLYTQEEMPESEFIETKQPAPAPRTARVNVEQSEPVIDAVVEPAALPVASFVVPPEVIADAKEKVSKTVGLEPATMAFGPKKGALLADLTFDDLQAALQDLEAKLEADPKARWARTARAQIVQLHSEMDGRIPFGEEPGAAG